MQDNNISHVKCNDIIVTDYSKNVKNYYIIMNTAKSLATDEAGSCEPYARHILASLWLNNGRTLKGMRGYIQNFSKKEDKEGNTKMYLGNVFKDDLYISNHLVISVKSGVIKNNKLKVGDYIEFNGEIVDYQSSKQYDTGTKFGITNFSLNRVIFSDFKDNINYINNLQLDEYNYGCEDYYDKPYNGPYVYMKYLISKLSNALTRIEGYPLANDYFLNMIISLHMSENIEKYMLIHQGDHAYLVDNAEYLLLPLSTCIFLIEELKIYDPFTILYFISNIYACTLHNTTLTEICVKNNISKNNMTNSIRRYYNMTTKTAFVNNYIDVMDVILNYSNLLLKEYNNTKLLYRLRQN